MNGVEEVSPPSKTDVTHTPVIGPATEGLQEYLIHVERKVDLDGFTRVRDEAYQIISRCKPFAHPDGSRTGLVVGYVQSGKTVSMTAVASLARDSGCRIVILLAGVTTNLLRQNATRFRDTLRGASNGEEHWLIINSEDGKNRKTDSLTLRNAVDEWHDTTIPEGSQRSLFFAVLKHHKHLEWLANLLRSARLQGVPALVLDDEADQAGLNAKPNDPNGSPTYAEIQKVRAALPNHTYLQYTATPQAPLLISIDDALSPDFAELVTPGNAYTGGETFFGPSASRALVKHIPTGDQFKPGEAPDAPPDSLSEALAVFFVGCAVARTRRGPRPRSMLIHPSQRTIDQNRFLEWTNGIIKRWSNNLSDANGPDRQDTVEELRRGWEQLTKTDDSLPSLDELLPGLTLSLRRVSTKVVNSDDGSEVDWANSEEHILIGGEKLNRGYTVEGLTVTYMPRDAGGWNADTLQQRARFFGYKRGYLSLCRLYLHPDVDAAYREYVKHEKSIRDQLAEFRGQPLREWRRAFFLDSRMRPTRRNVLTEALYRVKADEWFVQRYPHVDASTVTKNREVLDAFLQKHPLTRVGDFKYSGAELTLSIVLDELLSRFAAPGGDSETFAGHLLMLTELLAMNPEEKVLVFRMGNEGPRERSTDDKTPAGAVQLMQGRSSKKGGDDSDRSVISDALTTIQIHRINVRDGISDVPAVAIHHAKKLGDVVVQERR